MLEQAADFRAESDVLYDLLAPLSEDEFKRPTLFKEWTTNDILAHLHWGNMQADLSLNNEAKFLERWCRRRKTCSRRRCGATLSMPSQSVN